jgi:hypothetical protein
VFTLVKSASGDAKEYVPDQRDPLLEVVEIDLIACDLVTQATKRFALTFLMLWMKFCMLPVFLFLEKNLVLFQPEESSISKSLYL